MANTAACVPNRLGDHVPGRRANKTGAAWRAVYGPALVLVRHAYGGGLANHFTRHAAGEALRHFPALFAAQPEGGGAGGSQLTATKQNGRSAGRGRRGAGGGAAGRRAGGGARGGRGGRERGD